MSRTTGQRERGSNATMRTLVVSLAALAACGYQSQYVAPTDGRARAVWRGSNVAVELAGAPLADACAAQLGQLGSDGRIHLVGGDIKPVQPPPPTLYPVTAALWIPIYYGAPLVPLAPGVPPSPLRPPLFAPSLALGSALVGAANARAPGAPSAGDDLSRLGAAVVVAAILILPIVDVALAAAPAESPTRSSEAIDQVNLFNDLARVAGAPCAYGSASP